MIDAANLSHLYFPKDFSGLGHDGGGDEDNNVDVYIGPVQVVVSDDRLVDMQRGHTNGSNDSSDDAASASTDTISRPQFRRLIATRDIAVGEVLFVTPPVATANVDVVHTRWKDRMQGSSTTIGSVNTDGIAASTALLEEIAEDVLVQTCMEQQDDNRALDYCLSALEGIHQNPVLAATTAVPSMDQLLGRLVDTCTTTTTTKATASPLTAMELRQIIRRNAFGPDFVTYTRIAQKWKERSGESNDATIASQDWPIRILSLYPLAAMINHSCIPNAVRVYCRATSHSFNEVMIVHACQAIAAGHEIVWSYIPVLKPVHERQALLQSTHGFVCTCQRCLVEQAPWNAQQSTETLDALLDKSLAEMDEDSDRIPLIERTFLSLLPDLSNELKRYVRVSNLPYYMDHLNASTAKAVASGDNDAKADMLALATQLHLALAACHNASTEHLSILHLCYDLVCAQATADASSGEAVTATTTRNNRHQMAIRFWTDQLKRAILVRYGSVGNDIHVVRRLLQHTRTVLRNPNGMDRVEEKFI